MGRGSLAQLDRQALDVVELNRRRKRRRGARWGEDTWNISPASLKEGPLKRRLVMGPRRAFFFFHPCRGLFSGGFWSRDGTDDETRSVKNGAQAREKASPPSHGQMDNGIAPHNNLPPVFTY